MRKVESVPATGNQEPDADLLRRAATDPDAFRVVYDRHARAVYLWLLSRTDSPDLALDLLAETFAQAFRSAHRFRAGDADARPWLQGIAANLVRQAWRSRRVETRARVRLGVLEATRSLHGDAIDDAIDRLDSARISAELETALRGLSGAQRTAVELRVTRHSSSAEIARELECSAGAARLLVFRGLRHLKRLLGDLDAHPR
jgi:RNA polymerase sigma factor (sigma-70 family)